MRLQRSRGQTCYGARILNKQFLLTQYEDWTRHLASLNAELKVIGGKDRLAKLERARKAADWLGHYARLLRDGHGVQVG